MTTPSYNVIESCNYTNLSATGIVSQVSGALTGIFVASSSSTPTIKVTDGNRTLVNTFTPLAGSFYPMPAIFSGPLTVVISGTVDCTVFWTGR